jgi:CheY-like chemotaxis protein
METKPRVLLIEDRDTARKSWVKALDRAGFKVDGVADAREAIDAINRCTYHVAVIDIMLAGDDTSNRDGVQIVRYLRGLRENTEPLVLSGQPDTTLVRDLLRKYGAIDYVAKKEIEQKGFSIVIEKIRSLLPPPGQPPKFADWSVLVTMLSGGASEDVFVSQFLRFLKFKGGFENLSNSLQLACKHLVPLLPLQSGDVGMRPSKVPDVLTGIFWSKGQGVAVEIICFGTNASRELLEAEWNLSEKTTLYNREKAGLSIVVFERPDLSRDQFA